MRKFEVEGEELIEKEVKYGGGAGRIYVPKRWVGKRVVVIRIE